MTSTIIHSLLCPKSATVISDICTGQVHILHRWWRSFVVDFPWNTRVLLGPFREKLQEMVEAQIRELVTAVQTVQAQLMASEEARTTLQAQVRRMGRSFGERKIGVDTRNLGRLSQFNGTDGAWRDWSVVFRSYAALVHPALKGEMQRVERLPTAETHAGLLEDEQVQASTDLYHLLLHSTSGLALHHVVNGGSAEGLHALKGTTHTSGREQQGNS